MPLPSRSDRDAWASPAYDVAWRILHDRDGAVAAASEGLKAPVEGTADPASAVLVATRSRALAMLADRSGHRPPVEATPGLAFEHDDVDDAGTEDLILRVERAWGAAEAMGPADASLLDLHLRFEVPAAVIAETLQTTEEAAQGQLARLRGRLEGALASWYLWNSGRPRCDDLDADLRGAGLDRATVGGVGGSFDAATGRAIAKHAVSCDACRRAMGEDGPAPVSSFADAPVLRAPGAVRAATPGRGRASTSVFVDAETAATAVTETTAPPDDTGVSDDTTAVLPAVTASEEPPDTHEEPVADDGDRDGDGGPGVLAGIVVGLLLALVIVGAVTAWVVAGG